MNMRWFICAACCLATFSCSNASRDLSVDKDTVPAGDNDTLLSDSDDLLTDEPATDGPMIDEDTFIDHDPKPDVDTPITGDDAVINDSDIVWPDEDTVVTDEFADTGTPDEDTVVDNDVQPDTDTAGYCGDGIPNGTEACDDGAAHNGQYGYCNAICTGPGPHCGDGNIDTGYEECDDGDALNGTYDHCASDCQGLGPHCGDGVTDTDEGELCDDGWELNGTYDHCNDTCSGDGPHCGDGIVDDGDGEECDQSNDQYCKGSSGSGCDPNDQFRLRDCDNDACMWNDWSGCGHDNGSSADNFGDCPAGYEC